MSVRCFFSVCDTEIKDCEWYTVTRTEFHSRSEVVTLNHKVKKCFIERPLTQLMGVKALRSV